MKLYRPGLGWEHQRSLPSRGAWIEIIALSVNGEALKSLPSRGAWIEIILTSGKKPYLMSLPSRGAWIEIPVSRQPGGRRLVAPLTGSVD